MMTGSLLKSCFSTFTLPSACLPNVTFHRQRFVKTLKRDLTTYGKTGKIEVTSLS